MKKLILISLLIALLGSLQAQNTLSVLSYPSDRGLGLRYDRQIQNSGLYIAMSKGNYRVNEIERINNHIKTAIGYVRYMKSYYDDFTRTYFSAGMSYHYYSNRIADLLNRVYYPVSFDLGCGAKFKNTMIGFCFDFIKREGGINFGVNF